MASLADQLGWCITTKDYLNNLNKELLFVAKRYNESIDDLMQFGYIEEWLPELQKNAQEFEDEVRSLVNYIENDHLQYVDSQSQTILAQM